MLLMLCLEVSICMIDETEIMIDEALNKKKEKNPYLKRQQIKLKNSIESGMLNPDQQYAEVGNTIDRLWSLGLIDDVAAEKFFSREDEYVKRSQELQVEISKFYKSSYEKLLEL